MDSSWFRALAAYCDNNVSKRLRIWIIAVLMPVTPNRKLKVVWIILQRGTPLYCHSTLVQVENEAELHPWCLLTWLIPNLGTPAVSLIINRSPSASLFSGTIHHFLHVWNPDACKCPWVELWQTHPIPVKITCISFQ